MSPQRLAIDGGTPVRSQLLPYGRHLVDGDDVAALTKVLQSDWLTTGPTVEEFERAFADFVGAHHAVALSSGTAALHAAAAVAGLSPGDEAIVPPLTFVASANCVRYVGGTPVFVDVRDDTLTLDPDLVRGRINQRTKAIVAVDYGGQPCDLDDLLAICHERDMLLIEDAAHAIGATYRGRPVGAIADLTVFSLHPVKQLTTGEGGVVTTPNAAVAARLRAFRNHGISAGARERQAAGTWWYDATELGYNYRLTDIQSALGLSQLRRAPAWMERRRWIATRYDAALADLPSIRLPEVLPDRRSGWHLYTIRLHLERLRVDRRRVYDALRAENIGVNVHYIPVPWLTSYQRLGHARGQWPVAEGAYERLLTLPLWPGMADTDVDDVIEAVRRVLTTYARD